MVSDVSLHPYTEEGMDVVPALRSESPGGERQPMRNYGGAVQTMTPA